MTSQRRTFIKGLGTAATIGALSGCMGGGGNGGGSGPGMAMAPDGMMGVWMDHIVNETSILEDTMDEAGYEMTIDSSWEDAALFASGQATFSTFSSLEAAQLAGQRDQNLVVFGRIHPQYMGWMVDTGGDYDPDNTGSVQASIDALVEDDALVGIGAWNGGHVPTDTIAMDQVYGYEFSEEGGDFNVTTADYVAIPTLINDGELAAGSTSPEHGGARFLTDGQEDLTKLFWGADLAAEEGFGIPQLNSLVTTQEFWDQEQEAVEAFTDAFQQGIDWFLDDPKGHVLDNEDYIEMLGAQNAAQAEYIIDWGLNLEYDTDTQMVYEDVTMSEDAIAADREFIEYSESIGFVPEGWSENISFETISS
ncbi:substrate-binding domain-containing protein [Natrinema ejinorense]|nr:hypothetical protein [Natrinema ejinorense]